METLLVVKQHLSRLTGNERKQLKKRTVDYIEFRKAVDGFLTEKFSRICTKNCYQNKLSACCSKDAIIVFFADMLINALYSGESELEQMQETLKQPNDGFKCVYLTENGCLWKIKPIVCSMFLCDKAKQAVFTEHPMAGEQWKQLREKEKQYKWPDKPVLFDFIEHYFIKAGYKTSLMHLNFSPGLLKVKERAGLIRLKKKTKCNPQAI